MSNETNKTDELTKISPEMSNFFQRVDSIIEVANSQLTQETHVGKVGASLMYASARFSTSVSTIGFDNANEFAEEKSQIIEFYTNQFKQMLSDNLDDYIENFDKYTQLSANS